MVVVTRNNVALMSANISERAAKRDSEKKRIDAEKARDETKQANSKLARANTDLEKANVSERAAKEDADKKRIAADKARDETKQVLDYLVAAFRKSDPDADGETLTVAALFGQAAEQLETTFPNQPLIQAQLLNAIGETYFGLSLYQKAVAIHERARKIRHNELGLDHEDTLMSMHNLALAYHHAGRLTDALPLLEQTFEMRKPMEIQIDSKHLLDRILKSDVVVIVSLPISSLPDC